MKKEGSVTWQNTDLAVLKRKAVAGREHKLDGRARYNALSEGERLGLFLARTPPFLDVTLIDVGLRRRLEGERALVLALILYE